MSSGTQIDLDWTGVDPTSPNGGYVGQAPPAVRAPSSSGAYLTDEEILGMAPVGQTLLSVPEDATAAADATGNSFDAALGAPGLDGQARVPVLPDAMPAWMQTLAGDPAHGAEAQQFWQDHQAFRAAFSSPDEARAIKELFPGGAQEAAGLRQAAQSVEQIDSAIFSGDVRAQSEVVAELAAANPAAFRSLFAEAAKVLAGMGQAVSPASAAAPTLRPPRANEEWGTRQTQSAVIPFTVNAHGEPSEVRNPSERLDSGAEQSKRDSSSGLNDSPPRNDGVTTKATLQPQFDPVAYATFERTTNETVARDVRSSIGETLSRVLPEGVAEGAARRIGDDIFNEIHRALAADRSLSEQVGEVLRGPLASGQAPGQGRQFGIAEQRRVAALLSGRAKQLVPSVARRVIGEWTSSVLGTARSKAARQAAAASRVDIAAAGGSLDSMPLRAMSPREVDYASMSDDQILGL